MSMRDRMYKSAISDMTKDIDKDLMALKAVSSQPRKLYATCGRPQNPFQSCYLCGVHDNVMEIEYGERHRRVQVLMVCPKCKTWLGNFLVSDKSACEADI